MHTKIHEVFFYSSNSHDTIFICHVIFIKLDTNFFSSFCFSIISYFLFNLLISAYMNLNQYGFKNGNLAFISLRYGATSFVGGEWTVTKSGIQVSVSLFDNWHDVYLNMRLLIKHDHTSYLRLRSTYSRKIYTSMYCF